MMPNKRKQTLIAININSVSSFYKNTKRVDLQRDKPFFYISLYFFIRFGYRISPVCKQQKVFHFFLLQMASRSAFCF